MNQGSATAGRASTCLSDRLLAKVRALSLNTGYAWPSDQFLARELGSSVEAVADALFGLVEDGLVEVYHPPGQRRRIIPLGVPADAGTPLAKEESMRNRIFEKRENHQHDDFSFSLKDVGAAILGKALGVEFPPTMSLETALRSMVRVSPKPVEVEDLHEDHELPVEDHELPAHEVEVEDLHEDHELPDEDLVAALVGVGITPRSVAEDLVERYPARCRAQLEYLPHHPPKTNPAGFLRRAIERDYPPPRAFQDAARKEATRLERENKRAASVAATRSIRDHERIIDQYLAGLPSEDLDALHEEAAARVSEDWPFIRPPARDGLIRAYGRALVRKRLGLPEDVS